MDESVITDRHVTIKYLLGTLPEDERLRIEQAFFTADETFEELLAAEDELFGEYARGTLSPDERAAFEARFLSTPEGRRKLAFATALMAALRKHATPDSARTVGWFWRIRLEHPWLQPALAAAVVVLAVAAGWLVRDLGRERSRRGQLEQDLAAARTTATPPVAPVPLVVSVLLSPGLTRGSGDAGRITLAADADVLRVQLEAAKLAPGPYRATLSTAEGDIVWSGRVSRGSADDVIAIDVPARLLSTHDYEIALNDSSASPAASYVLTVVRR